MSIQSHEDYIKFEELCENSFRKPEEAIKIEGILQNYFLNPNFLLEYKSILQFSKNSCVIAQVARGLLKCITSYWNSIPSSQRNEIKTSIGLYLESIPPLEPFSLSSLLKLYSRLVKFSWQEDSRKIELIETMLTQSKKSHDHHILFLRQLRDIIREFNDQAGDHLSLTQHRNLSILLRDQVLMKFYTVSLDSLKFVLSSTEVNEKIDKIREYALDLSLACLTFDFIKASAIDSSEEILTVQIPTAWKPIFDDLGTTDLYFKIYKSHYSTKSLECLISVASVRKSLFQTEDERVKFITNIFKGTKDVLANNTGFFLENNHLAFCRILERIKTNYYLNQLISIEGYSEWISLVSTFTIETLKNPQFSPNSIYYLLSLWAKFVATISYIKGDNTKAQLDKYTPTIMETFLNSKIEGSSFSEEEDENLMDYDKMVEMLENIPFLGRLTYNQTAKQVLQFFDRATQQLAVETNINNITILERQCAWLVYTIGCLIFGRTAINSSEEYDTLDGNFSARVFKLIDFCDKKKQIEVNNDRSSRIALELSFIYFMQNFKKIYIGESTINSSKIYPRLSELLGLTDHNTILFSIIRKIGFNFKYWCDVDDVIKRSLDLFWDSVNGHSTAKILLNTSITHEILKNHNSEVFPFLDKNPNTKHRSTLYKAIAKLLFTDENNHFFDEFIQPFDDIMNKLQMIQSVEIFRQDETKKKIVGLMRDLRGITTSAVSKRSYIQVFEFLNPRFSVLLKIVQSLVDCPEVTNSLLKLLSEYVHNKQTRLNFESSSPNGYIIFRETSKILVAYGSSIINLKCSSQDLYKYKLKGISLLMTIFTRCLTGNYCNFGVFELFGDKSFHSLLDITFQLLTSITLEELINFPKVSKNYMILIEALCTNHTQTLVELNSSYFGLIMYSILKGVENQDIHLSTQSCVSLDKIVSLCHSHYKRTKDSKANIIRQHFNEHPTLMLQLIDKLFFVVIYEDNLNQWSISKPLLSCILFSPESYNAVKQKFIQLNPNSNEKIELLFTQLMADIQDNLETKNRDKFTQNVATFRREMRLLGASGSTRYF